MTQSKSNIVNRLGINPEVLRDVVDTAIARVGCKIEDFSKPRLTIQFNPSIHSHGLAQTKKRKIFMSVPWWYYRRTATRKNLRCFYRGHAAPRPDFFKEAVEVWALLIHEIQHIKDSDDNLVFSGGLRRPKWATRPEEIRANYSQECARNDANFFANEVEMEAIFNLALEFEKGVWK